MDRSERSERGNEGATSNKSTSEEVKKQFRTREGYYVLMNSPDYSQRSQHHRQIGGYSNAQQPTALVGNNIVVNSSSSTSANSSTSSSADRTTIKISLVTIPSSATSQHQSFSSNSTSNCRNSPVDNDSHGVSSDTVTEGERKICFNVGRELFVYNYNGVRNGPDTSRPALFRKAYKGSLPTCHDFNQLTASHESILLLVGFTHGQIQLIDLIPNTEKREYYNQRIISNGNNEMMMEQSRLFNEDRLIDKTKVTCVKWLPGSANFFLVSHASGQLYVYKIDLTCGTTAPSYQIYRQSDGVTIYTCKTKTVRNPVYRWSISGRWQDGSSPSVSTSINNQSSSQLNLINSSLNEFAFSPCAKYLACVSQDGFLRVFCYDTMELIGRVRSYYGGLLCVCWSHDSKFVVTGGEDDLITIWSFLEKRVIARGQGHKSWINVVAFDPYCDHHSNSSLNNDDSDSNSDLDDSGSLRDDDSYDSQSHDLTHGKFKNLIAKTVNEAESDNDNSRYTMQNIKSIRINDTNHIYHSMNSDFETNSKQKSPDRSNREKNVKNSKIDNKHQTTLSSYRFGSVGQDTLLCFWDLTDDIINHPVVNKQRTSVLIQSPPITSTAHQGSKVQSSGTSLNRGSNSAVATASTSSSLSVQQKFQSLTNTLTSGVKNQNLHNSNTNGSNSNNKNLSNTLNATSTTTKSIFKGALSDSSKSFTFGTKKDRSRHQFGLTSRISSSADHHKSTINQRSTNSCRLSDDPVKLLGTPICPRIDEVPILEPTVCKKISYERLTSLMFCHDGFITSCQDGFIFSWIRPNTRGSSRRHLNSYVNSVGTGSIGRSDRTGNNKRSSSTFKLVVD